MDNILPFIIGHITLEDVLHAFRLYIIIHVAVLILSKLYIGINKLVSMIAISIWSAIYEYACNWYYQRVPKTPDVNSIHQDEFQVQQLLGQVD